MTAFNGKRFDSHSPGWKTLYKTDRILVELEQAHFAYWRTNKAFSNKSWRVSLDGNVIEEGTNGVVPRNGGKIFLEPDVYITIWAANFSARVAQGMALFPFTYFVFLSTSNFEGSEGWCTGKESEIEETPPFNFELNKEVTEQDAEQACAELKDTFQFESCKTDALLLDNKEILVDITESFKKARELEEEHGSYVDEGPPPTAAPTLAPTHAPTLAPTPVPTPPPTMALTSAPAPVEAPKGVNGDPLIMGLDGQVFKFDGRSGGKYDDVLAWCSF